MGIEYWCLLYGSIWMVLFFFFFANSGGSWSLCKHLIKDFDENGSEGHTSRSTELSPFTKWCWLNSLRKMLFTNVEPDAIKESVVDLTLKNAPVNRIWRCARSDAVILEGLETQVSCFHCSDRERHAIHLNSSFTVLRKWTTHVLFSPSFFF